MMFIRKTIKLSVSEHILDAIINRELLPGERIIEGEMAKSLGIAKTTLREALQGLEHQGVLMKSENRGTYVTKLTVEDVRDIYNVRIKLEPEAAVLAYRRLTARQYSELAGLVDRMRSAGERKDYLTASKADLAFHQMVWKTSGNRALEKALNAVSVSMFAFSGLYLLQLFSEGPAGYARICDDHRLMLAKLKEGPAGEVGAIFVEKLKVFQAENLTGAEVLETEQGREDANYGKNQSREKLSV